MEKAELLAGLQSKDTDVRIRVAEELAEKWAELAADPLAEKELAAAVQTLITSLEDEIPAVRIASIGGLACIKSLHSVTALTKQLSAADSAVREAAAQAFWTFGSNDPPANVLEALQVAVDDLVRLLNDPDPAIRLAASGALACTRNPASLPALRRAARDADDDVRRNAVWAVGRIPDTESLPLLVDVLLSDKVPIIRRNAAVAIGSIVVEGSGISRRVAQLVSSALLMALKDDHEKVRQNAAHALATIPSQRAVDKIVAAFDDETSDVRQYAAWAVGEMQPVDQITGKQINFADALQGLGNLLDDSVDPVRQYAVWAISQIEKKDQSTVTAAYLELTVPDLLGLLSDTNSRVRHNAAYALAYTTSEIVIPSLIRLLHDADAEVRGCAAFALGNLGSHYAVPALVESLVDEDDSVRHRATETLSYLASLAETKPLAFDIALQLAVPSVVKALEDTAALVRTDAVTFLSQLNYQKAIPGLIAKLMDSSEDVRAKSAWALGEMEAEEAVPHLVDALRDPAPMVRRSAVLSLGSIGQIASLPAMRTLLSDRDPEVLHAAKIAILRLPLPPSDH